MWNEGKLFDRYLRTHDDDPNETIQITLSKHSIKSSHRPSIEVKWDGKVIKEIHFDVEVELDIDGAVVEIQNGRIKKLKARTCTAKGEFGCEGLTLIRCGGHFPGATVLHWASGAEGHGALLSGDTVQVAPDRRHVSFMYSYPNQIPLAADSVRGVVAALDPFVFDRIYGGWWNLVIREGAKEAVRRSAERYVQAIGAGPS